MLSRPTITATSATAAAPTIQSHALLPGRLRYVRACSGAVTAVASNGLVGSSDADASSCAKSDADVGLKRGSRASACITAASTGSGTEGSTSRNGVIAPLVCCAASSARDSNSYGGLPVNSSYTTAPSEYTSVAAVTSSPAACSGDR